MRFTATMIAAMLVYLGKEPGEGSTEDNKAALDSELEGLGLDSDSFLTKQAAFTAGYTRGLQSMPFDLKEQIAHGENDEPDADLQRSFEDGYARALEARELVAAPPASLVFAAYEEGLIAPGNLAEWAKSVDLSATHRLAVAQSIASGSSAIVVPAGMPIDVITETEIDGVKTYLVAYDGCALRIPAPEDGPDPIVSGDTVVAAASSSKKARKPRKSRAKSSGPRKPTLKEAIIYVAEGLDGGPGPLQSNGEFASRVQARCRELGIPDAANKFMTNSKTHVPYYLTGYKPKYDKETGEAVDVGRTGVEKPLVWVLAAIRNRRAFLAADGDFDARIAALPEGERGHFEDREARVTITKPESAKAKSKDDGENQASA